MVKKYITRSLPLIILTFAGLVGYPVKSRAQIFFEQSYNYSGTFANLEKEGPKFYLMDIPAKECRIYNLDYTLFRRIALDVPAGQYLYDIQFVTEHLFDADDGVELLYVCSQYVETTTSYYYIYTTRVVDDNGTILLSLTGGSWTEILNVAGSGSRMMTYVTDYSLYPYPVETRIYRLPGTVLSSAPEVVAGFLDERVFPNPTSGQLHMPTGSFDIQERAEWVILDVRGNLVARQPVREAGTPVDLKSLGLASGTYLVRMESKHYQTKFQQVVFNN